MIAHKLLIEDRKRRISEKCRFDVLAFLDRSGIVHSAITAFMEGK